MSQGTLTSQPHVALILAAGEARRMGHPKQLIEIDGVPLVRRAVALAEAVGCAPVVVLGAHRARVEAALSSVERVYAPGWAEGMGATLVAGMSRVAPWGPGRVTIMLCDQPLVTADDLRRLHAACDEGADGAAAAFDGVLGPPACFTPAVYPALRALPPRAGARRLLRSGALRITPVPMPAAAFDLDTPADLDALKGQGGR